eukprot:scaffold2270_cov242-Ochromonas_danica.AAC.6
MNELPGYFCVKVIELYKWLGSRNIFLVEDFPVRLYLLKDLQNTLNLSTYCPSLRSIDIDRNEGTGVSQREVSMKAMQDRFRIFLKQCTRLNSVTIKPHTKSAATEKIDTMLLSVMTNELKNNTLVKIDLEIHSASTSLESITGLLSKHTSSIRDVNRISLRRLTIDINPLSSQRLLDYLSCFGAQIEILEVGKEYYHCIDLSITEEVLLSIGRACPRLRTLLLSTKERRFSDHTLCSIKLVRCGYKNLSLVNRGQPSNASEAQEVSELSWRRGLALFGRVRKRESSSKAEKNAGKH